MPCYTKRLLLVAVFLMITEAGYAQSEYNFPKEVKLVFDYIIHQDYPELFNDKPYQFRPIDWAIHDIDNDGKTEVFLQTFPHYCQSPTITIYQINPSDSVSRITEGLAPGPLIALSPEDDYFDTHTTGTAVDMELGNKEEEKLKAFAKASIKYGMSPVLYQNFVHTDKREGKPTFLDLTYLHEFNSERSCKDFQFARAEDIIAGRLKGEKHKYFIALVANEMYCYEITGFDENGWINKKVKIIQKPSGFKSFLMEGELIKYETERGEIKDLEI